MNEREQLTGDQLADALAALGVRFLVGGRAEQGAPQNDPVHVIAALADSDEAWLRLALSPCAWNTRSLRRARTR